MAMLNSTICSIFLVGKKPSKFYKFVFDLDTVNAFC